MSACEFVEKWKSCNRNEKAAAQEHFIDLCHLVGVETPNTADPTGAWYAFEKGAEKVGGGDGFADVWKKGFFAWEYKGKRKDLGAAYQQLLQYREALENPPLLVVSDLDRFEVHTNFTGTAPDIHRFDLDDLENRSEYALRILRAVMLSPEDLKPHTTSEQVTKDVAEDFAGLADALRDRGHDGFEVAHFLNRLLFCFFAEGARLLPPKIMTRILEASGENPLKFNERIKELFGKMSRKGGGAFGPDDIQWFNGGLFSDDTTLPLRRYDLQILREAAHVDWSAVEPAILGTLFERAMDPGKRAQLGAHYTDKDSIMDVVEPVVMMPLRREFEAMKTRVERLIGRGKRATEAAKGAENPNRVFRAFLHRLRGLRILDPACGSGNFLYLSLRAVKDLEKEAIVWGSKTMGWTQEFPGVGPQIVLGIEQNTYAAELARVSIWIGEIQWMLGNGFGYLHNPVLRPLNAIENRDAVLTKDGEEPAWPKSDFIIGNPPFLGGKLLRRTLGNEYVDKLFKAYKGSVPAESDYVCYWFEKARAAIETGRSCRAGLLATQGIRGGKNSEVLKKIKESGDIFLAWSDRDWVVEGAQLHVSIIGFDDGRETMKKRDGKEAQTINADLSVGVDLTKAPHLDGNAGIAFMGDTKGAKFEIEEDVAQKMLTSRNPSGLRNSDVVVPWLNGKLVTKAPKPMWIVDFGNDMSERDAALYAAPFEHIKQHVRPDRIKNSRERYAEKWWIHSEPRPGMRKAIANLSRFIGTVRVSKHRIFFWIPKGTLPDCELIVFARDDDYTFGVLQSRIHSLWSLAKGTQLETRERYTPTTTFETFSFPEASAAKQRASTAEAAERLNSLRDGWLDGGKSEKRTLTGLYNDNPSWLQNAHADLDRAVMKAYGWPEDLPDEEILQRLLRLGIERAKRSKAA